MPRTEAGHKKEPRQKTACEVRNAMKKVIQSDVSGELHRLVNEMVVDIECTGTAGVRRCCLIHQEELV